jgi:hypothetical protein
VSKRICFLYALGVGGFFRNLGRLVSSSSVSSGSAIWACFGEGATGGLSRLRLLVFSDSTELEWETGSSICFDFRRRPDSFRFTLYFFPDGGRIGPFRSVSGLAGTGTGFLITGVLLDIGFSLVDLASATGLRSVVRCSLSDDILLYCAILALIRDSVGLLPF